VVKSNQGNRLIRPQESRPVQPPTQGNSNPNIKCFRCGEQGHRATDYRKPASQKGKNLLLEEDMVATHMKRLEIQCMTMMEMKMYFMGTA
jgi:hypothetical protein